MMHGRGGYHHGTDPPSKRYRRDDNADPTNPNPSIVVHVRNLHQKVTEADLLEALSTFGPIAYATCIPHSRMALVEFETIEGAKACVNYAASNNVTVGGQAALFNYSTSQCIERMGFEGSTPNKVLVVTILNATYPIDADVIYTISSNNGKVLRVAVMHKPTVVQALVEFESIEVAKAAKHAMNGADIYAGCCTLKVEFAKPERVRVTRQDKDQRDFTLGDNEQPQDSGRKTLIPQRPDDNYSDRRSYQEPRDQYDRRDFAPPQPPAQSFGYQGRALLPTQDFYGNSGPPQQQGYYDDYNGRGRGPISAGTGGPGCVLMVYGLDHDKINCDMIFNILCQYGNVLRISFMRTKTETGIIEMGAPDQRRDVLDHLQGTELFGLRLEFKPSHQECVHYLRDPFTLPDGTPSFKDYSTSRNQRFSSEELAKKNRIVFPTNILHWFNAPGTMDEPKLLDMIAEKSDHKPVKVDVFPSRNERSAAGTVEFDTVEAANEVLALVNHMPVDSPYGSAPFIVKWAYATPRRWEGGGGDPVKYEDGADGDRREGYIQPAARPYPPYRRGGRGGGDFGGPRRDYYRGGMHGGGDRFAPYPPRGGGDRGGFRGGRGRGRFNDY